jgi:hypothetical protein
MSNSGNIKLTNKLKKAVRANGTISSGTGSNKKINNLTAQNLASFSDEPISMNKMPQYKKALKQVANKKLINNMPSSNLSKVGTSKTTNNIKSNASTSTNNNRNQNSPKQYITSLKNLLKSSIKKINANVTLNNVNSIQNINSLKTIINNRSKYDTQIEILNTLKGGVNTILNKPYTNKNTYIQKQKNNQKNNWNNEINMPPINSLYTSLENLKNKLTQQQKVQIPNAINRLNEQKNKYIQSSNAEIINYLQKTFVEPLNIKKEELTTMLNTLKTTTNALKNNLGKNNELNANKIKQNYNTFTKSKNKITTNLQNKSLSNQFTSLQNNLKTLGVNLTNTNNALKKFNTAFTNNVTKNLGNSKKNINNAFNTRIQIINTSIEKKTTDLGKIVTQINDQIKDLQQSLGNSTLNKAITGPLNNLINQMTQTITEMTNATNQQEQPLKNMMTSLRELIGSKKLNGDKSKNQGNTNASTKVQQALARNKNGVVLTSPNNNNKKNLV